MWHVSLQVGTTLLNKGRESTFKVWSSSGYFVLPENSDLYAVAVFLQWRAVSRRQYQIQGREDESVDSTMPQQYGIDSIQVVGRPKYRRRRPEVLSLPAHVSNFRKLYRS
jgi:hypothetical protein